MVIPWSPCGRICGVYHKGYTTMAHPFKDSDFEWPVEWYPAREDALFIDRDSVMNILDWDREDVVLPLYRCWPVGEIADRDRVRNFIKPLTRPTGDHVCGTLEEWADGAVYDPDSGPMLTDADGLPLCCRQGGGIQWGGEVPTEVIGGTYLWGGGFDPILGGVTCDLAALWFWQLNPTVYVTNGAPGFAQDWIKWTPATVGSTYRIRVWLAFTTATVRIAGGTSCLSAGAYSQVQGPGVSYAEFTQTIPVGVTTNFLWLTDTSGNAPNFLASISEV